LGVFHGRLDLGCPRGMLFSGFASFLAFEGVLAGAVSGAASLISGNK